MVSLRFRRMERFSRYRLSIRHAAWQRFRQASPMTDQSARAVIPGPDSRVLIRTCDLGRDHRQYARILRLHYLQLFCHPDWPHFLSLRQPVCQPDAVAGDVWRGLRHPTDWRVGDRILFRPRRSSSSDDPELCDDGVRDHRTGADAVLSNPSASPRRLSSSSRAWCRGFRLAARSVPPRPI